LTTPIGPPRLWAGNGRRGGLTFGPAQPALASRDATAGSGPAFDP
jgi:hypothetical protein